VHLPVTGEEATLAVARLEIRVRGEIFRKRPLVKEQPYFFLYGQLAPRVLSRGCLIVWPAQYVAQPAQA
jgi:hypothetical protein